MLSHYETLSDRVQRIQDPENLLRVGITPEDKETLEMYMAVQPYGQLLADKYHADLQKFHYKKRSGAVFGTGVFFIGLLIGGHYVSRRIGQNKQAASSRYSSVPDKVEPAEY